MDFSIVIPARYLSSRLPGKMLKDIHGKTLIEHVFNQACKSQAKRIIIATDDRRIEQNAKSFGAQVCMTDNTHTSGSARIAQVIDKLDIDDDEIIVNMQGDEPMIDARVINQVATNLANSKMQMATLCQQIKDKNEYLDPNCVKVVFNKHGKALYFSRSAIPFFREDDFDITMCFKHIGIYAYQAKFIKKYITFNNSNYEKIEKLEQLSVLDEGFDIHIETACGSVGYGVDVQEDLDKVIQALK